jgi:hypothetical protein
MGFAAELIDLAWASSLFPMLPSETSGDLSAKARHRYARSKINLRPVHGRLARAVSDA